MRLKIVGFMFAGVAVVWAGATTALYAAMLQPPEKFGAFMAHVPMPAMMVLPFRPLWMSARSGTLSPGDTAPDFTLKTVDGTRTVTLSQEWRERPVVLIFGSYT